MLSLGSTGEDPILQHLGIRVCVVERKRGRQAKCKVSPPPPSLRTYQLRCPGLWQVFALEATAGPSQKPPFPANPAAAQGRLNYSLVVWFWLGWRVFQSASLRDNVCPSREIAQFPQQELGRISGFLQKDWEEGHVITQDDCT